MRYEPCPTNEEKRGEGASSIGGRINKGRVVINSVRHVVERERQLVVDSRGGLLIFSILLFRVLEMWAAVATMDPGQSIKINPSLSSSIHVNMLHARELPAQEGRRLGCLLLPIASISGTSNQAAGRHAAPAEHKQWPTMLAKWVQATKSTS